MIFYHRQMKKARTFGANAKKTSPAGDGSHSKLANRGKLCYDFGKGRSALKRKDIMEKITSFTIDHIKLRPGLYVSRKDRVGAETVTTFDLRLTNPNEEPVMNTAEVHTIEHLGATYLRNEPQWKDRVLYFGPMGCRTGFYLLLSDDCESRDIVPLVLGCFRFIRDYRGEVPGACAKDCGNYLDMNLPMANYWGARYAKLLENIDESRLVYPE